MYALDPAVIRGMLHCAPSFMPLVRQQGKGRDLTRYHTSRHLQALNYGVSLQTGTYRYSLVSGDSLTKLLICVARRPTAQQRLPITKIRG